MATHIDMPNGALSPRGPRVEVRQVVYVTWPGEPAFILNLSEGGLEIQAMEVLQLGRSFSIAFPLPDGNAEVQSRVRIVWADCSGRAGLEFVDVSEYDRQRLKQWMEKQN
jgi:hypothetical protein